MSSKVSAGIAIIAILVIVSILSSTYPKLQAQTDVMFGPANKFSIPAYNGTISFGVNGTYSNASVENGTWTFMNLRLNGSLPLENLEFSAQNCNVSIFLFREFNTSTFSIQLLSYVVEGQGKQILTFDLGSQRESSASDWNVAFGTRVITTEGNGWNLLPGGRLSITGASENENITILHYVFLGSFANNSNLPFYQQHSIALITAIIVAVTLIAAIVVKVKTREHLNENELVKRSLGQVAKTESVK